MSTFEVRALEIHNSRMWRWSAIDEALGFIAETGMNALVLHQNDLIDALVFPSTYISSETFYQRWPVLRSRLLANRLYITQVIEAAAGVSADVYLEVKELSFPEQLLQLKPDLLGPSGAVCPTHPFFMEYLEGKVTELFSELPGLAGIIVSPATREAKASIATRTCSCERCEATDPRAWYEALIGAMHRPIAANGKTLVVRDFAYSASEQGVLVPAARAVSDDIVMALKNVPHDFWPTFPDNPLIGQTGGLRQWMEYDVFGQYVGLGIVPCDLSEDVRERFRYSAERGVTGVLLRTDWELIDDTSVVNSLNEVNLVAGALLARDLDALDDEIYGIWISRGVRTAVRPESCQPGRLEVADNAALVDLMRGTWPILREAVFTRGHVFQFSSKVPTSLDDLLFVAHGYHGREQWDPGSSARVAISRDNFAEIRAEKDRALQGARALRASLRPAIMATQAGDADLAETFDLLVLYADLFRHAIAAGFAVAVAISDDGEDQDRATARDEVVALEDFTTGLPGILADISAPFYLRGLMNVATIGAFAADLRRRIEER